LSTVCFLDNDIILKLIACNLLDESVKILNLNESDLRVLPSLKYYFNKKKRYSEEIRIKIKNVANRYQTINSNTPGAIQEIDQLLKYEDIDNGEALLIAATREEESFWLTTGDKRFLRALANSPELISIVSRLEGRVICLEQLIRQVIYKQGFQPTLVNILPARQYDTSLKSIFGSGENSTKDSVLSSLDYYIEDLRKDTKGMLRNI
jgi:hypothetical protein